jgi:hypothetical protein
MNYTHTCAQTLPTDSGTNRKKMRLRKTFTMWSKKMNMSTFSHTSARLRQANDLKDVLAAGSPPVQRGLLMQSF